MRLLLDRAGIRARVVRGGTIRIGDAIVAEELDGVPVCRLRSDRSGSTESRSRSHHEYCPVALEVNNPRLVTAVA